MCVCVCVCVRARARVCVGGGGGSLRRDASEQSSISSSSASPTGQQPVPCGKQTQRPHGLVVGAELMRHGWSRCPSRTTGMGCDGREPDPQFGILTLSLFGCGGYKMCGGRYRRQDITSPHEQQPFHNGNLFFGGPPKVRCGPVTVLPPRLPSHGHHRLLIHWGGGGG